MTSMELPADDRLFDIQRDALYDYDASLHKDASSKKPWTKDPRHFKTVRISAVALVKMVMHARSGGELEVMGLMQGYVDGTALVITDAFRLPVEGTETRVNAQDDANEYLVEYLRLSREEGRQENVVGWYHSHPGYGCWLSGIDVDTQTLQQRYNDPFVAVVIDPDQTVSVNKVAIGAFRTYPEDHNPNSGSSSAGDAGAIGPDGYQAVPLSKVEDFGAHSDRYYSLEVEHFKSTLDTKLLESLWNKYWVQTLSQNQLLGNRHYGTTQLSELGGKVKRAAATVQRAGKGGAPVSSLSTKAVDQALEKVVQDAKQVAAKEVAGLTAEEINAKLFNSSEPSMS